MNVGPIDTAAAYAPAVAVRAPADAWRAQDQEVPATPDVKRTELRVEAAPGLAWVYTLVDASTGKELWRWPMEGEFQVNSAAGQIVDLAA
jgi:hypothetical protein